MIYFEVYNNISVFVENACKSPNNVFGYGIWTHHIRPMVEIGRELHKIFGGDLEVIELAILLHDIAGIQNSDYRKVHHIIGAEIAVTRLTELNYKSEKIEVIKKCILNHRGSVNNIKETIEEKIVADSDALAHIREISSLYYVVYKKLGLSIDEGIDWIKNKIDRDYEKMSTESKNIYSEEIENIKKYIR